MTSKAGSAHRSVGLYCYLLTLQPAAYLREVNWRAIEPNRCKRLQRLLWYW